MNKKNLAFIIFILILFRAPMKPSKLRTSQYPSFIKIGHRGACGYKPENTLASFEKALKLNVDMVELDVHVCSTGQVVVIHDPTVTRTTDSTGLVSNYTLQNLQKLRIKNKHTIPTLVEVLDLINKKIPINIELKGLNTAEPVARIIKDYQNAFKWNNDRFLVSSFNYDELAKFSALCPTIALGILCVDLPSNFDELVRKFNPYAVCIYYKSLTAQIIQDLKNYNLKILVYTVNNPEDIDYFKGLQVDGIFSDFPDRL